MNERDPASELIDSAIAPVSGSMPAREQRASTLVGDRLCIKCCYNLTGQPVLREPHYDMLIVRCPECGMVASVQEYPLLGRWANRWAMLFAGLWVIFLLALWLGSSAAIWGLCTGTAEVAAEDYRDFVLQKYSDWQTEQNRLQAAKAGGTGTPGAGSFVYTPGVNDFDTWWKSQTREQLLAEAGGWWSALNGWALIVGFFLTLLSFVFGVLWATALLGLRRRRLLIWGVLVMGLAAGFSSMMFAEWYHVDTRSGYTNWWQVAGREICGPVMGAALLWGWLALSMGLLFGRSVTRGLLRLLLPPRLRSPLAALWIADGLEPPR